MEECDDGNLENDDGCSNLCQKEGLTEVEIAGIVIVPIMIIGVGGLLVYRWIRNRKMGEMGETAHEIEPSGKQMVFSHA